MPHLRPPRLVPAAGPLVVNRMNDAVVWWWSLLSATGVLQSAAALGLFLRGPRCLLSLRSCTRWCAVSAPSYRGWTPSACVYGTTRCRPSRWGAAATVAEVALLSVATRDASFVGLAAAANGLCWLAVLTLNQLWHCAEETLWAAMGLLLLLLRHRRSSPLVWLALPYVPYMATVD
jgi:hypothetical protein